MATISDLTMWKDCGFLEGDVRAPKIGATLPAGDYHLQESISPSKARLFSQLQLKVEWTTLREMSYLKAVYELGNESITIYGWIDAVTLLSDSEEAPMTAVDWHVDYWRTYNQQMIFKDGHVNRAPSSQYPQGFDVIRWKKDRTIATFKSKLNLGYDLWWLIYTYITDGTFVKTETFVVPLKRETSVTDIDNYIGNPTGTENGVLSITLNDVVDGKWDELLKLQSTKIKGAWLVPIDPGTVSGSGIESDPFRLQGWRPYKTEDTALSSFKRATEVGELPEFPEMEISFDTVSTSDIRKLVVTGMDGETVGEVPWGLGLSSLKYRIVISAASCYIQIRTGIDGHSEGTCYSIPAIVLDTIENAWSEYNYSGQRAYDMNSRSLQAQQKLIGSLTTGVLGGGLAGATQEGMSAASIAKGAGVGFISGALGGVASYALSEGLFNPQTQGLKDALVSKQSDGLIISGAGYDAIFKGSPPRLISMVADDATVSKRSSILERYGMAVNKAVADCQSLINAGGPLQISNLTIGGTAPIEAKRYAKQLFERGVKLI